jgi:hypothetical protein
MARSPIIDEYQELIEYLAAKVPPDYLLDYKASQRANERVQELLDHKSESELTADEAAELEAVTEMEEFVSELKLRSSRLRERKHDDR